MQASRKLKIAIIGRPNVGKSTLFNQLTGSRKAVVKDRPGVTRDIHWGESDWCGVHFILFDTAGVTEGNDEAWSADIRAKALKAAQEADKIIFVLDGKFGLNPEDKDLSRFIKQLNKPVFTVVNKLDGFESMDIGLAEFFELQMDPMIGASFEHKLGIDQILDWVVEGEIAAEHEKEAAMVKIAVIGKPNAGKSTLVNKILGENRVVVSPVAGTTVDSVEVLFNRGGKDYVLIDTAGLRRHAKRNDHVELISAFKAEESVAEADILLLVIDGLIGPSHQDARIVQMALEHHRGVILVINKIDVAQSKIPKMRETMKKNIEDTFHFFKDIPVAYISAKTGRGVDELFTMTEAIWNKLNLRVTTREINEFFFDAIRMAPSPSWRGHDIKFYYVTQTKQRPPSFMAYVNEPKGVTRAYQRFLVGKIKDKFDLHGIPIRIYPKKRRRSDTKAGEISYGIHTDQA